MIEDKEAIGWYGKIPSLGDFISRRLPVNFIERWDSWLQQGMSASREILGEEWLDSYLTSPMWRFILMPDTCSNTKIWTGILMPSIDKVGRHFPLTIATEVEPSPHALLSLLSEQHWYTVLEEIALASLDLNKSADDLDESLANHHQPSFCNKNFCIYEQELSNWWQSTPITGDSKSLALPTADTLAEIFSAINQDIFSKTGIGKSIWWKVDFETDQTQLHCFNGLPPENKFVVLLNNNA